MKGKILTYSPQENAGVITADDNARYPFTISDWKDPDAPTPYRGAYVDFVIQDNAATEIYLAIDAPTAAAPYAPATTTSRNPKEKVVAGIFALVLGGLGIHKFYLGYTTAGIIHLIVFFIGMLPLFMGTLAISIIGIIEGIIYLTKSDEEFQQTYVIGQKQWF